MDQNEVVGKIKDVAGQAEAAVGDVTGDRETQASGRVREATGKAQQLYGQAQDAVSDALGDTAKSAERLLHSARDTFESGSKTLTAEVNARPLIAILIAGLIGYVVASLMHSSTGRR